MTDQQYTPTTDLQNLLDQIDRLDQEATPIPGFPDYEITHEGDVYSLTNWRGYGRRKIKPVDGEGGYLKIRLRAPDGRRVNRQVHRLVALTFIGPRPSGMQVRHLNGDHRDNRIENLSYGTAKQNAADRDIHGTTARGSRNGFSKLTESDIPKIREMLSDGIPQTAIAERFSVCQNTISNIKHRRWWKHVA